MTENKKEPLKGIALVIASIALAAAVFMQVLDTTIANVCVPYIAGDLAVSKTNATWVITMFAAGNSIFLPLTGWLTTRFGNVRVMAFSTFAFTVMSWLCGISPSFDILIIARFFQGAAAGPLIPLSQSLMILAYPAAKKNVAIAIWTMVALVGPITGPILGGWIVINYTWHWIFLINIPVGILATITIWKMLAAYESETKQGVVDYIGFLFLAVGVTALQVLLDKGQQLDWWHSGFIQTLSVLAILGFISLYIWEKTCESPLIDFSLLRDKNFALGTLLTGSSYIILFGAVVITPLWLQTEMGYNALLAGMATSTMGIIPVFIVRGVAHLLDTYQPRYLLSLCFTLFAGCYFFFAMFTPQVSFALVSFSRLLFGLPISLWLPTLTALSFATLAKERLPMAMGVFHFFRMMCGGVGTSLMVTMWERRASFHQTILTAHVTPYGALQTEAIGTLTKELHSPSQALAVFYKEVIGQTLSLATNDVFLFSGYLSLVFLGVSFFFKGKLTERVHVASE